MESVTVRGLIRSVLRRWESHYTLGLPPGNKVREDIPARLAALDLETASAGDVAAVIGDDSWTTIICAECDREVAKAVRVGEEPDEYSATAVVCRDCLVKALALLDAAE